MAKPRVFLSSTFYDLRHLRTELERFIRELGYDPVLHERGQVPYGNGEELEQYCYREVSNCEIVVNIVGGRFGSASSADESHSISQMELKTAHRLNKQIYVFVERSVHTEYGTWQRNSASKEFKPFYVDDVRVYSFLSEVNALKANNVIFGFESTREIVEFLRDQWAGLFQRFLQQEARNEEYKISANLKATAETLSRVIEFTTKERDDGLKSVLVSAHPVFGQIREKMNLSIRVSFINISEMKDFFKTFGYVSTNPDEDPAWFGFCRDNKGKRTTVKISRSVFDDFVGDVVPVENGRWSETFADVTVTDLGEALDEDVPF